MARQLRSRPQPVLPPLESDSPPGSKSTGEWAELLARPSPPTDPDQVFRDHAADLADRYDAVATDVEEGLRRLAATFLGERAADAVVLDDALRRPPLTLLADALGVMPAEDAVRLIRNSDLGDLDRRVRTTAWLVSPDTPLYSTDELAAALVRLAADLHADREHLVRTGLPSRPYPGSQWLYHKLGRLYPTRQAASFVPYAERVSNPRPGAPPHTWLQTPHRDVFGGCEMRPCEYEQADFLPGLSAADGLRVEGDRTRLLDVKLRLLGFMAGALTDGRGRSFWADVLGVLTKAFTADDIEFYVGQDGRRAPTTADPTTADDPRSPGGLTDWIELAGHVEQELTVGTLAAARDTLTARTRELLQDLSQGGPDRNGVPPGRLYMALYGHHDKAGLDDAIDAVFARRSEAEAFWAAYRERVNTAIKQSFRVMVPVTIGARHAGRVAPLLPSFASYAEDGFAAGRWPTHPSAGLYLFRWDDPTWTIAFEGKILGKPHAVGLVYLGFLLERPHRNFEVGVLRRYYHRWVKNPGRPFGDGSAPQEVIDDLLGNGDGGEIAHPAGDLGEIADAETVGAVREREGELLSLIEKATSAGDNGGAERWREELQQVRRYLKPTQGLGGKRRRVASTPKNDRDVVVKAVNEAIKGFEKAHPALHRHLERSLVLGPTCCYRPAVPVNWQF